MRSNVSGCERRSGFPRTRSRRFGTRSASSSGVKRICSTISAPQSRIRGCSTGSTGCTRTFTSVTRLGGSSTVSAPGRIGAVPVGGCEQLAHAGGEASRQRRPPEDLHQRDQQRHPTLLRLEVDRRRLLTAPGALEGPQATSPAHMHDEAARLSRWGPTPGRCVRSVVRATRTGVAF